MIARFLVISVRMAASLQSSFGLTLVWWTANWFCAIDTQRLLQYHSDRTLFIELTLVQIFTGAVLSTLILFVISSASRDLKSTRSDVNSLFLKESALLWLLPGVSHFLGTFFTNMSYALLGSTSTLVWKMSEPASTIFLKHYILKTSTSLTSMAGAVLVMSGVGVVGLRGGSPAAISTSPVVIANVVYPLRNVLVKKSSANAAHPPSSLQKYRDFNVYALPLSLLAFLCKVLLTRAIPLAGSRSIFMELLQNSLAFNIYQIASISLLSNIDAVTHSLANAAKRAFGVLVSAMVLGENFTRSSLSGISISFFGLF